MEQEAAAIEHDSGHARLLRRGGDVLAHLDGGVDIGARALFAKGRGRGQGAALGVVDDLRVDVAAGAVHRQPRRDPERLRSAVRTRRRRRSNRESLAMLLLLPFLAEDVLATVLDALALVGLRLAPATDLGGELADRLLVDPADFDRGLVGSLHLEPFGHVEFDIVAVAELKLELLALRLRAIADAGDLQGLRKALG